MEADLAEGKIGNVGSYDVEFKGGKLVASVKADLGVCKAGVVIEVSAEHVINAIEKAIPGQLDDAILEILKKTLIGV